MSEEEALSTSEDVANDSDASEVAQSKQTTCRKSNRRNWCSSSSTEIALKTVIFLNQTWMALSVFGNTLLKISKAIKKTFEPENYVFFRDSNFPYKITDVKLSGPGIAPIAWHYDAANKTFISAALFETSQEYHTKHLPFLTGEIKYNDLSLYDISDFIETVRWAAEPNEEHPSIPVLFGAWSLHSGVILHASDALKLEVINDEGESKTFVVRP
jgi:hypothetical protein